MLKCFPLFVMSHLIDEEDYYHTQPHCNFNSNIHRFNHMYHRLTYYHCKRLQLYKIHRYNKVKLNLECEKSNLS